MINILGIVACSLLLAGCDQSSNELSAEKRWELYSSRDGTMWTKDICALCGKPRRGEPCTNRTCPNYGKK